MSLFAMDKWARLFRIISQNGGIINSSIKLWRIDTLKITTITEASVATGQIRNWTDLSWTDSQLDRLATGQSTNLNNKITTITEASVVTGQIRNWTDLSWTDLSWTDSQLDRLATGRSTNLNNKEGKYVGTDCLGNRYYENKNYMIARSRWVEYHPRFSWNYDASHVSAEWYGWLHYKTDKLPSEDWAKYLLNKSSWVQNWLGLHEENYSGTQHAFYPYSTTRQNIRVWNGKSIPVRRRSLGVCDGIRK